MEICSDANGGAKSAKPGVDESTPLLHKTVDVGKPTRDLDHEFALQWGPFLLYVSHFLSAFGDRLWQFALPVLMMDIWSNTLLPTAIVGFTVNGAAFLLMPAVGGWCDHHDRLVVMAASIALEAGSMVVAAVAFAFLRLSVADGNSQPVPLEWTTTVVFWFSLLCLGNVVAELSMRAGQQALEKDWAVVLSKERGQSNVEINTKMRRIDLSCKLLGPSAFGFVVTMFGSNSHTKLTSGVAIILLWNICGVPIEYFTVRYVYNHIQKLRNKDYSKLPTRRSPITLIRNGWEQYLSHLVRNPSLAYGLLWFTVLDNGVLMTAYLKWIGIDELSLGVARGMGAIVGIIGTILYPAVVYCAGESQTRAGYWSIWAFWLCLIPIGVSFLNDGTTPVSAWTMIAAVTISRAALWIFDLSIQDLLQNLVSEESRGIINGVHTSVSQFMLVSVAVSGMFFSRPEEFSFLVWISLANVLLACLVYSVWYHSEPLPPTV